MTEITYGKDGAGFYIEAAGHSGFDIAGRDVVCAGISALIFAEIDFTRETESAGYIEKRTVITHDGFAYLHVRPREGKEDTLAGAYGVLRSGLRLLSESYPDYLHTEERNE